MLVWWRVRLFWRLVWSRSTPQEVPTRCPAPLDGRGELVQFAFATRKVDQAPRMDFLAENIQKGGLDVGWLG